MPFLILAIALASLRCTMMAQVPINETNAELSISVVDMWGHPIRAAEIVLTPASPSHRRTTVRVARDLKVLAGLYRVQVTATGMGPLDEFIMVRPGKTDIVLCAKVGYISYRSNNVVYGRILNKDPKGVNCDTLATIPVFCREPEPRRLHSVFQGGFGIDDLEPGKYLFAFFSGAELCAIETVAIGYKPGQHLVIELPSRGIARPNSALP